MCSKSVSVAQLVEHSTFNRDVTGSTPAGRIRCDNSKNFYICHIIKNKNVSFWDMTEWKTPNVTRSHKDAFLLECRTVGSNPVVPIKNIIFMIIAK